MVTGRTTKEILEEKLRERNRIPLYNQEALQKITHDFEKWKNKSLNDQDNHSWRMTPHTILGSDTPREMFYSPVNAAGFDYSEDSGYPGEEPYTRGLYSNMYRGKMFTMRQLCGAGSREQINQRIKNLLEHGATGINLILDTATIQMYDSDEPEAKGQVGTVGAPINCVDDMEVIFKDIPIDQVSVSIVTHYPTNTAIIFPMYLVMAERKGIAWSKLKGSVQNDFVMETAVRSALRYLPPKDSFRIQCDNIEFLRKHVPRWNCCTFNGYNLREYGTSAITEMAVAFANAIDTIQEMKRRGFVPDTVSERLAFFWSSANDFFEEIARLRAARKLWFQIMKYRFDAQNPRSMLMKCHMQTSGISLTREEPLNNIVRAAFQALAVVLGGAQSLHVDSYDEAYSIPSEEASLLSLRTQQIMQTETGITNVIDPLGGSFYIETLTEEIAKKILNEIEEIERMGGITEAVVKGWLHEKVARYVKREQEMINDGKIQIVGRNYFRDSTLKIPDIHVYKNDQVLENEMHLNLKKMREKRNNKQTKLCLNTLGEACRNGSNVMAACLEAARTGATIGEMRRVFENTFGEWKPPRYV
jgi:methylmalonyl-CoA mutase, N-terminal domain